MLGLVLAQQIINGVALGSIYALIALGYTMVYGIIRLINFAHGDVFMVGAYLGYFAITVAHLPFFPALLAAMAGCALVGMTIERLAYKPLRTAPRIAALITAIGVSLFLENLGILVFGARPRAYPQVIPLRIYDLGGIVVNNRQFVILGISVGLMILLQAFVQRTKVGKAMRAVAFDKETAALMGIDVNRIISWTFALGSALAAAAGILVGLYFNKIEPLMGIMPGLKAFVAAVLGGIGIIPGAAVGGFIMGIAEVMVIAFLSSTYRDAIAFGILIIILLVKPSGLLGRAGREKV